MVTRRGFLAGAAACLLCAGGTVAAAEHEGTGVPTVNSADRLLAQPDALFRVRTREAVVALTFDDGPDPAYTPTVLDLLDRAGARATFFAIGVNATARPRLLDRVVAAGHTIGNHTFDHRDLELLTPAQVAREIDRGEQRIIAAGAPRPTLFRPPKGLTDEVVGVFADADRYHTVFWDHCLEHHVDHAPTIEDGVRALLRKVRPGSIILAHDGGHIAAPNRPVIDRTRTMEALPVLLRGLHRLGYRMTDVPGLLASTRKRLV